MPSIVAPIPRRLLAVAVGAALTACALFGDARGAAPSARGDASLCVALTGDAARACYVREVGRELASVSGRPTSRSVAAAVAKPVPILLCPLHAPAGTRVDESTGWGVSPGWAS